MQNSKYTAQEFRRMSLGYQRQMELIRKQIWQTVGPVALKPHTFDAGPAYLPSRDSHQ